ncbi:MAG: hypothetical protein ACI8S6_002031 [Myxococcota bacterium]|jgi:hypothetical protein
MSCSSSGRSPAGFIASSIGAASLKKASAPTSRSIPSTGPPSLGEPSLESAPICRSRGSDSTTSSEDHRPLFPTVLPHFEALTFTQPYTSAAISATGWSDESPEGSLCCPSAAGSRPAQAAQRRQDPPDPEAARTTWQDIAVDDTEFGEPIIQQAHGDLLEILDGLEEVVDAEGVRDVLEVVGREVRLLRCGWPAPAQYSLPPVPLPSQVGQLPRMNLLKRST